MENIERHLRIMRFLIDANKLMDGVHLQETTEDHSRSLIKFEATLTCLFSSPCMWSPTSKFFDIIMILSKKYFRDVNDIDDFGWNNTKCVFWIGKEKI